MPAQASDIDDSTGKDVLLCATSQDDGASWTDAQPIEATLGRPPSIRDTGSFEVYPGTLQTLPDDRVLVTWQVRLLTEILDNFRRFVDEIWPF